MSDENTESDYLVESLRRVVLELESSEREGLELEKTGQKGSEAAARAMGVAERAKMIGYSCQSAGSKVRKDAGLWKKQINEVVAGIQNLREDRKSARALKSDLETALHDLEIRMQGLREAMAAAVIDRKDAEDNLEDAEKLAAEINTLTDEVIEGRVTRSTKKK